MAHSQMLFCNAMSNALTLCHCFYGCLMVSKYARGGCASPSEGFFVSTQVCGHTKTKRHICMTKGSLKIAFPYSLRWRKSTTTSLDLKEYTFIQYVNWFVNAIDESVTHGNRSLNRNLE